MILHETVKTVVVRGYRDQDGYNDRLDYDLICHIDIHGDVAFLYGLKGVFSRSIRENLIDIVRKHDCKELMFERHGKLRKYRVD